MPEFLNASNIDSGHIPKNANRINIPVIIMIQYTAHATENTVRMTITRYSPILLRIMYTIFHRIDGGRAGIPIFPHSGGRTNNSNNFHKIIKTQKATPRLISRAMPILISQESFISVYMIITIHESYMNHISMGVSIGVSDCNK
jgi:hypothetical protein